MKLRHLILVSTALAGFACGVQAQAQGTAGGEQLEEIIVTGIRGSLRQAIEVKRQANSVVDVISAEDVGKFPDRNVAESLSHIPGVSIDRRFGEGEKVAIHGTDPALNRMLLDGHALASADWGGNDNDPSSRTFNYSLLAPELVDRLEVYKSPEAQIEEGSIGGTVIVRTRKPLDMESGSAFASAGYSYNDRSEKGNGRASGLLSWKNEDETFGILGAVTYDRQNLTRGGVEFFGYDNVNGGSSPFLKTVKDASGKDSRVLKNPNAKITGGSVADLDKAVSPFGINYAYFQQVRERTSVSSTAQWRPSEEITLTASGLHIDGNYNNYSQSMYTIPGAWTGDKLLSATINNGVVTAASFDPASSQSAQLDTLVRRTKLKTDSLNLEGEWEGSNGAKVKLSGGWSKATGGRDPEYLFNVQTKLGFDYAFTDDSATVNFKGDPTNPANYFTNPNNNKQTFEGKPMIVNGVQLNAAQIGGLDYSKTTDRDIYGGVDTEIPLEFGPFTKLLFGGRITEHVNRVDASGLNTYLSTSKLASQLGVETLVTPDGVFDGSGGNGNATKYLNLPREAVIKILADSINFDLGRKIGASNRVQENVAAGYTQLNFEKGNIRGNIGGRLVYTRDVSDFALTSNDNPVPQVQSVETDYLKFLPNFNIAYEFEENVILRGAVAKVISRPRYGELAGSFSQNDVTKDAGGGNPNLKPYESVNYEISAEWYPKRGTLISLELFRREIDNYILNSKQTNVRLFNGLNQRFEDGYTVNRPINAGSAKVNGVLIAGQSEIWNGFGIQANYTYADSSTDSSDALGELNLPYLSKHTVSVIPYYEDGPFQARLSYNYRSSYFRTIGRLNSRDMVAPYTQLDFSAGYQITDAISLTVNAQNLLDETYIQYNGTRDRPTAFYKNGRTYAASISYRM
ncbi:TonB-dependent receptor [Niveispirillum sp. BGYR6]|uniref:TonB-dependent receptor n=1 Tax=Niveispirillum sp. BGYR6 TaxID=2971249 RepID=UPI0022B9899C|nr:TonB-dependent receptor [Niveispirillum sp. BGYR6]MDG5494300.1 TonB-dependent receptor [Niveispirillum sp. BGYR6]